MLRKWLFRGPFNIYVLFKIMCLLALYQMEVVFNMEVFSKVLILFLDRPLSLRSTGPQGQSRILAMWSDWSYFEDWFCDFGPRSQNQSPKPLKLPYLALMYIMERTKSKIWLGPSLSLMWSVNFKQGASRREEVTLIFINNC